MVIDPEQEVTPTTNVVGDSSKPEWVNKIGLSRKHIFDAVDASVERLGTYLDVLQIHRLDRETPMEEIMKALHDVVCSGKVRYIGGSNSSFPRSVLECSAEEDSIFNGRMGIPNAPEHCREERLD